MSFFCEGGLPLEEEKSEVPIYLIKKFLKKHFSYESFQMSYGEISCSILLGFRKNKFNSSFKNIFYFLFNKDKYWQEKIDFFLKKNGYNNIVVSVNYNNFSFKIEDPQITKIKNIIEEF